MKNMLINTEFVLASASPRRKQILSTMGFRFTSEISSIKEDFTLPLNPEKFAVHYAQQKAKNILESNPDSIVVGADTIVVVDNHLLGKPANEDEAKNMLKQLSGKTHRVITGVSIQKSNKTFDFYEVTEVEFKKLELSEITWYISLGEAFDKAGAYGIQGAAGLFIKKINGCYYNVVGFPVASFYNHFKKFIYGD